MARRSVVKISFIVSLFGDEESLIHKGENSFESQHVKNFLYDGDLHHIEAKVHASMKDKEYDVKIDLNVNGTIKDAQCSCPRGLVRCHHIAAALFYAHHNVSVTDQLCQWNQPKSSSETTQVRSILKCYPKMSKRKFFGTKDEVTEEERGDAYANFKAAFGHHVTFCWRISPELQIPTQPLHCLAAVLHSAGLRNSSEKAKFLLEKVRLGAAEINSVERGTIGQSANPNWLICKRFVLSASNFWIVLKACSSGRYPKSLFQRLLGAYDLSGVKQVAYGNACESEARASFEDHFHVKAKLCGLFLHPSGIIGASPDGLINDNELLEIKCPHTMKNSSVSEAIKLMSETSAPSKQFAVVIKDGSCVINENHAYYHQVQGQLLHITGRKRCHLMIWSRQEFLSLPVLRDESWSGNIQTLINFYTSKFLP